KRTISAAAAPTADQRNARDGSARWAPLPGHNVDRNVVKKRATNEGCPPISASRRSSPSNLLQLFGGGGRLGLRIFSSYSTREVIVSSIFPALARQGQHAAKCDSMRAASPSPISRSLYNSKSSNEG